jgi:CHAT domain-containing protein/Tfp pilus assembly protein PilF
LTGLIFATVAVLNAPVALIASISARPELQPSSASWRSGFALNQQVPIRSTARLSPSRSRRVDPPDDHRSAGVTKITGSGDDGALAETLEKEAGSLCEEWTESSFHNAIAKLTSAISHWQAARNALAEMRVLLKIGDIQLNLAEYRTALLNYERALTLASTPAAQAECHNSISLVQIYLGDHRKALAHSKRAYDLSKLIDNRREQARALTNQGEISYASGDLQNAAESLGAALSLWPDGDRQGQARSLLNLGYVEFDRREMDKALANYQGALEHSRSGDKRNEALALTAIGGVFSYWGNQQTALDYHNQALKLFQTIGDRNGEGVTLNGLGYVYRNLGDFQKSLDCSLRALKLFQDLGLPEYENFTITCVGTDYQRLGDNTHALEYFQMALDRSASYSQTNATALNSIGSVFEKLGDSRKALSYYKRALDLYDKIDDRMGQASILDHLGDISLASGNNVEALKHFQKALALSRLVQEPSGEAAALFKIASALIASGDYLQARRQIEDSIKIIESLRVKVASQNSRAAYFASTHEYYEQYVKILMRLHQNNPNEGLDVAAFDVSEKARARSFLESLKEARSDIHEGIDASLMEQEQRLGRELNIKAEQHLQLVAGKKTDQAEVVAKEIDQIITDYEEVRAQIRAKNSRYANLTEPQPIILKEIQQHVLDDDSLLLEYMIGDDSSYLWLVSRTQVLSYALPGRAEIEKAATDVHSSLIAIQPLPNETFDQRQARIAKAQDQISSQISNLSKILLEPVAAKLQTKRLLIVADGALSYIPFQVLNAGNAQRPLIVDHEIVNEPSASALALLLDETKNRKPATKSVAVLADPVFESDDPRITSASRTNTAQANEQAQETDFHQALEEVNFSGAGHIPRLLASRAEAQGILAMTPWRSGFEATGFDASRATVTKTDLSSYRIVHFATHGLLNNEHPELSGIVLSLFDEQGKPQDGYLRLHDIYNLKLPVDLVVLSACNTALGKDVKGEGLVGLTRGFMYAGASSVVASLWKVDDEATAELMRYFYGFMLRDGLSPAAALRKAQVTMSQQKRWQSPYYWSGFIIQGQYIQREPMIHWRRTQVMLLVGVSALLILAAFFIIKRRRRTIL